MSKDNAIGRQVQGSDASLGGSGASDGLSPSLTQVTGERQDLLLKIMTAEHSALQSARASAIADANGRASLFIAALSSSVVGLALVAQLSELGTVFFAFALVLLPTVFFLGIAAFDHVLGVAIEDTIYVRGMNRIRHLYVELAPESREYFIMSIFDDPSGSVRSMVSVRASVTRLWQLFLTSAGMLAVVNSVVLGVLTALIAEYAFGLQLSWCGALGIAAFVLGVVAQQRYQSIAWQTVQRRLPVVFPSQADGPPKSASGAGQLAK